MPLCETFARLIAMHGGLEALADDPIWVVSDGVDPLRIEFLGDGLHGGPTRLVSIAHFMERDFDLLTNPEMIFEVDSGGDRKTGWESGRWLPVAYHNVAHNCHVEITRVRDGGIYTHPMHLTEYRGFVREWDRRIAAEGYVETFAKQLRGLAILMREQAERREKRRAKRRADREPRPALRLLTLPA